MFFNSVIGKNGFAATLAGYPDERLIVRHDVEIFVDDVGLVFGSRVEVYKKLDRVTVQHSSARIVVTSRIVRKEPAVERLNALRKGGNRFRVGLDQSPFAVFTEGIRRR